MALSDITEIPCVVPYSNSASWAVMHSSNAMAFGRLGSTSSNTTGLSAIPKQSRVRLMASCRVCNHSGPTTLAGVLVAWPSASVSLISE